MLKIILMIGLIVLLTGCIKPIINEPNRINDINNTACVEEQNLACCKIKAYKCYDESFFKGKCEKQYIKCKGELNAK